jgi:hypothetical protein
MAGWAMSRRERAGHHPGMPQRRHALRHLSAALSVKVTQDLVGRDRAGLDGIRRAAADHARLAGPRPGDDGLART